MPAAVVSFIGSNLVAIGSALGAGAASAGVAMAVGAAAVVAGAVAAQKLISELYSVPNIDSDRSRQATVRGTVEPQKLIYGEALVSGPINFVGVAGTDNRDLYHSIVLAGHPSDSISDIYFDDERIQSAHINASGNVTTGTFGPKDGTTICVIRKLTGSQTTADSVLDSAFSTINSSEHIGTNLTYIVTKFTLTDGSQETWDKFLPNDIKALVKGKKVYDPRQDSTSTYYDANVGVGTQRSNDSTTWEWSENPVWCLVDYLTDDRFGMGIDLDRIDLSKAVDAADICDATVSVPGGSEKRYTCNGVVFGTSTHKTNINKLLSSMNGMLTYTNGKYVIRAGAFEAVGTGMTLTEDHMTGPVRLKTSFERNERFNTITGTFIDPSKNYKEIEFPKVQITSALTRDNNEELTRELKLSMTNSRYMAQRIAHKLIQLSDLQKVLTFPTNLAGVNISVGDRVNVTLSEFGYTNKTFVCLGWTLSESGTGGVNLTLREDDSSSYADLAQSGYSTVTPAGGIQQGFFGVPDPSGLTATAHVESIELDWTNPANMTGIIAIEVFASPNSSWSSAVKIGETIGTQFIHDESNGVDSIVEGDQRYYWVRARRFPSGEGTDAVSDRNPDSDTSTVQATKGALGDLASQDTVGDGQIDDNAVGNDQIADDAVDTDQIADDAVTVDKIANTLESTNYSQGVAGWKLTTDGTFEAADALFRGNVTAETITVNDQLVVLGPLEAKSLAPGSITREMLSQDVLDEIFGALATSVGGSNGDYKEGTGNFTTSGGTVTLGTSSDKFDHGTADVDVEFIVDHFFYSTTNYTTAQAQATLNFEVSADGTFTDLTSATKTHTLQFGEYDLSSYYGYTYLVYYLTGDVTKTFTSGSGNDIPDDTDLQFRVRVTGVGTAFTSQTVPFTLEANEGVTGVVSTGGNADTLDNLDSTAFLRSNTDDTFDGNLTITGDLILQGGIDQYNVTNLTVDDKTITVNAGSTQALSDGAGLIVDRGTAANASITWDETNDRFEVSHDLKADDLRIGEWSANTSYAGLFHANHTGEEYILISSDTHTFISATTGNDVRIRGGNNISSYEVRVYPDQDATASGNKIWHAGDFTSTNVTNWNTAYTYSQVGHLPLAGGTMTGTLNMGANAISSTGTISSGSISTTGTITGSENQNAGYIHKLTNTNTGTSAYTEFIVESGTQELRIGTAQNYASGQWDGSWVYAAAGDLFLKSGSGHVKIYAGDTVNPKWTFNTDGSIRQGNYNGTTFVDSSRNITAGSISSGDITTTGTVLINDSLGGNSTSAMGNFDRLEFSNSFSDVMRGPNKILMYNSGGWIGGFGIADDQVTYSSGGNHVFYSSQNSTTYDERFRINGSGDITVNRMIIARSNSGVSAPSNADHTLGTRIKFFDGGSADWYAQGIESGNMWFNTAGGFKWYNDSSIQMTLSADRLGIATTPHASDKLRVGGSISQSSGSIYAFGDIVIGMGGLKQGTTTLIDASRHLQNIASFSKIFINRQSVTASGISWYSSGYKAWATYMSPTGGGAYGPTGNITAPSGTLVTSWALRNFIENAGGYGWTFESGTSTGNPTVVAEIRSSDGAANFNSLYINGTQRINSSGVATLGTTTTGALTATNITATSLSLSGTFSITSLAATSTVSGSQFRASYGSVSAPAFTFKNDDDTGMYGTGGEVKFAVNGSSRMTIGASATTVSGRISVVGDLQAGSVPQTIITTGRAIQNVTTVTTSSTISSGGSVNLGNTTDGSRRFKWYNDNNHSLYYDDNILGTASAEVFTYWQNVVFRHRDSTNAVIIGGSAGTISSGAITTTGKFTQDANGAVNSINIHDDDTSGQPGIHITNALTGYTKEFYAKTYGSNVNPTIFGVGGANRSIVATAGSADAGLLIGTLSAQSVIIGAGNSARITIPNSGAINFHSQSLTSIGTISSGAITSTGNITGAGLIIDGSTAVDKSGNYMVFYDGSGNPALYAGNTADNRNYYQSNHHRFRSDGAGTTFAELSSAGLRIGGSSTPAEKLHVESGNIRADGAYLVSGTTVIDSSRVVQNVTLKAGGLGSRFEQNSWHQSADGYNRFYFASASHTYFRTGSGYIFRDNGDTGRATISAYGGINLLSGGDGHVASNVALAVGGTTTIDSSRNVFGVNGSFTGYAAIGSRVGTINPSLSVDGATNSSPFLAKSGSYSTVFSVLPWSNAITYLASGAYYQGGSWVHASPNDYECLLGISGDTGGRWYATTNGVGGSWNHVANVQLWNNSGNWTSNVDTNGTVTAGSGSSSTGYYVGTTQIVQGSTRNLVNIGTITAGLTKLTPSGYSNAPQGLAALNIGRAGSGETRAIDIWGSWNNGESKSITFNHGSSLTQMVGQINCVHSPSTNTGGSSFRWGKLYHGGDSSQYVMELHSESTSLAYLNINRDMVQIGQDSTYTGTYATIGFGGRTNGYNRIFGRTSTADGLFLASATGHGIYMRPNGSDVTKLTVAAGGQVEITQGDITLDQDGTYGAGYGTIGFGGTSNGYNRVFARNSTADGLYLAAATGAKVKVRANGSSADTLIFGYDDTYGGYASLGFGGGLQNGYNRIFASTAAGDGIYITAATGRQISFRVNGQGTDAFKMDSQGRFVVGSTIILDQSRNLTNIGKATFSGSGAYNSPTLSISVTGSGAYIHASNTFASSMTGGNFVGHFFGKAGSTKNSGYVGYVWSADASDNNYVSLGHWGNNHLLRLYADGDLNINDGGLQIGGTTVIDTSRNLISANITNQGTMSSGSTTLTANYTGGSGDYTNIGNPPLKIVTSSGYARVPVVSAHSSISIVHNFETAKDVYWGEPNDTGVYYFRGRNFYINNGNTGIGVTPNSSYKLYVGGNIAQSSGSIYAFGDVVIGQGGLKRGSTTLIDASRNLTNIASATVSGTLYTGGGTPTGSTIGTVRAYGSTSAYMGASDAQGRTAFFGVDSSGYAMFGALTNHHTVIRANNGEKLRIQTNGVINIAASGVLAMNGTTVIDASRNLKNIATATVSDGGNFKAWTSSATSGGGFHVPRAGFITFFGDTSAYHGIGSRNLNGAEDDDIRINSYGGVSLNLDSNGNDNTSAHSSFFIQKHGQATSVGTTLFKVDGENANVTTSGNVTAYGSPSDIRLKENIERIADPIDKVKQLDGITFDYKKDGSRSTGLIAQQLLEVLPEVVYETEDLNTGDTHYAVRYGQVVGLLVEAIKDQQEQIDLLKDIIKEMTDGNN